MGIFCRFQTVLTCVQASIYFFFFTRKRFSPWNKISTQAANSKLVYCLVRDWTRFCYVIGFENTRIHHPHVIRFVGNLSFSTLESRFKNIWICCQICWMHVDRSRIRKEKVADSKISGYVWTGPKKPTWRQTQPRVNKLSSTASTVSEMMPGCHYHVMIS